MISPLLNCMCCPKCWHELRFEQQQNTTDEIPGVAKCWFCGGEYRQSEGFIHFIGEADVFRFSKREEFFRSIYAFFYTPMTNLMFLPCGGVKNARREVLEQLEIKPRSNILETGIGTGDNILFLRDRLDGGTYYGLDNQLRMLRSCAVNLARWNRKAYLCRANAEELPYKDNSFDVVFHLGAINLFQHKKQAIDEMIRVARPGSKIVIADETEKAARLFAVFTGKQEPIIPPVDLVPSDMLQLKLRIIWKGYGYLITFRKPV